MSRSSYHDMGAAMAYGQACSVLEAVDSDQANLFPISPALLKEWRGIKAAALDELIDIGHERDARRLARTPSDDCDVSDVSVSSSVADGVR